MDSLFIPWISRESWSVLVDSCLIPDVLWNMYRGVWKSMGCVWEGVKWGRRGGWGFAESAQNFILKYTMYIYLTMRRGRSEERRVGKECA